MPPKLKVGELFHLFMSFYATPADARELFDMLTAVGPLRSDCRLDSHLHHRSSQAVQVGVAVARPPSRWHAYSR